MITSPFPKDLLRQARELERLRPQFEEARRAAKLLERAQEPFRHLRRLGLTAPEFQLVMRAAAESPFPR